MVEHLAKDFRPTFLFHRFAGLFVVVHCGSPPCGWLPSALYFKREGR
nr:MAG TPA: hypothetical protein [Caudoviricetes sp.]